MYEEIIAYISPQVAIAVLVAVGLILCFVGYKLFKLYTAAIGFIFGFILSHYVSFLAFIPMLPIILGIVFAMIFWLLYRLGLFLTGALIGYMIADSILPGKIVYAFPVAFLAGLMTLFLEKALLILITAFLGSTIITYAVYVLVSGEMYTTFLINPKALVLAVFISPLFFLLWLVLGVIGTASQIVVMREKEEE